VTTDATTNHILGLKNTRAMSVAKTKNQKRKPFLKVSSLFGCKISPYFSGIIPPRFKFMLRANLQSHHDRKKIHSVSRFAYNFSQIRLQIVYFSSPYLDMAPQTIQFSHKFEQNYLCDEIGDRL